MPPALAVSSSGRTWGWRCSAGLDGGGGTGKIQCSWRPGAGWECLCEQQVRGRSSSTADVEGLAREGFRRGGCEGTRAPPRAASCRAGAAVPGGALQGWRKEEGFSHFWFGSCSSWALLEQFKRGDGAGDGVKDFSWLLAFPGLSLKAKGVSYFPPPAPCLARCLLGGAATLPCVLMINDRGKETPRLLLGSRGQQPPTQAVPDPGAGSLCLD